VERALGGSPHPFASDPEAKRRGMAHFQPDALTISRGELWRNRRRFAEAVLDSDKPIHRLGDRLVAVVAEELGAILDDADRREDGHFGYRGFHRAFRRITRRIVLGDAARDDEQLTDLLGELMSEANGLPSAASPKLATFVGRIERYMAAAEPGSLAALAGDAPQDPDTRVAGQLVHWLFAMADTLPANALRALALLCSHPSQRAVAETEVSATDRSSAASVAALRYLRACLQEAMRLWPTTPLLSRETLVDLAWDGAVVAAGTQVLIPNTFLHRDRDRLEYADRFAPEAWTDGDAADYVGFNHFSRGPQGCPGAELALLVASAALAELLAERQPRLLDSPLDPAKPLPHMLDFFALRFASA
jgi:cytochrome P450